MNAPAILAPPAAARANAGAAIEWRAMAMLVGILAAYSAWLLPYAAGNGDVLESTIHGFVVVGAFAAAVLALADIAVRSARRQRRPFAPIDFAWYAVAAVLGAITIPIYGIFKQLLLPARGFPLDPYLADADRLLFFGGDPWRLTHAVLGTLVPTLAIDAVYSSAMVLMFLFPVLTVALVASPAARTRLIACWLGGWMIVGTAAAWLLASAGPCYYDAVIAADPSFHALTAALDHLARQATAHGWTLGSRQFQPMLLAAEASGRYAPAGGISAAPSVHVTMATLFAIAGYQIGRRVGVALTAFAVLIWIGSIHLGWHYATDGILGAAMMLAMWRGSAWITRSFDRTPCAARVGILA